MGAPTTPDMERVEHQTGQPIRTYLMDAYLVRLLPTPAIASEIGVNQSTVVRWLAKFGIPARPRNYAGRGRAT